jgi:hypothetical protein
MIPKRKTSPVVEEHGTVKRESTRFFWPGMVLIVALCAFTQFLAGILHGVYGVRWLAAAMIFFFANFTLAVMIPKAHIQPAIEGERTPRQHRLPNWSLIAYGVIISLGFNWVCVFLWFSRKYALFSTPVLGVTGLIFVFFAAIALFAARLTGRNWRTTLLIFVVAPGVLAAIVLRLGLLR